ncbi:diguanylate cyclase [Rhizobium sp. SSA_523]|uniref:GGDEF domain-containing response regulator n=1 Tax=Rhizobium sp. SSA_523 TaxID=2952477 RepID=UPI0020900309|nr:diguanylate cyclase [Rhizobium sp. SSA_523]MCO5730205.1 diguanylate cyclase [Rhizobium sp. SSA_523]WKC25266.1 diguanylate cyclase [Rhizobium sp. SSA_523]
MPYVQQIVAPKRDRDDGPVLLVEDSRTFASILSYRFREEIGRNVCHCASLSALQETLKANRGNFPVAVVDLNLPGSPHGEVLDLVISFGIPVIVFTGSFDMGVRERILDRRVVDYVVKDNERACDMIVDSVRRALANRDIRVLVVHEAGETRTHLAQMLRAQLLNVIEVATGEEGRSLIETNPDIELVVIGKQLPDMDGLQFCRRIRRKHGEDRLRLIGLLPTADRFLSVGFIKAGADDVIYQPLLAEEVQCRVAHAIDTLSQLKRLRIAASSDYLTGLSNRRYFYLVGPDRVEKCLQTGTACSMALVDIDHFRRINETYGNDVGDTVLMGVASCLQQMLAGDDQLIARLGGEEFALLLVGMDGARASIFCEMLRHEMSRLKFTAGDQSVSITVSIGVAEIEGRETFDNYLNAADQFLFMAKQSGRDRVFSDHWMRVIGEATRADGPRRPQPFETGGDVLYLSA